MTNEQTKTLVLKDAAGSYFLVPMETLEQGRVPEDRLADVERLLAEQDEVQGFIVPLLIAGMAIGYGAVGLGYGIGRALRDEPGMTNGQLIEQITGQPFPPRPQ